MADFNRPPIVFDFYNQLNMNELRARAIAGPYNQAFRASQAQRQVMFNDPRNNPSRSQFSQGYTSPFQYFAASNTWQTPSGQTSRGRRAAQPSIKFAGPRVLIQTTVPWG